MKLYHLVLTSLLVGQSLTPSAKAENTLQESQNHLSICQSSHPAVDTDECKLLEDAYQRLLQLDQVESQQKKYIDGNVQMEMMFNGVDKTL